MWKAIRLHPWRLEIVPAAAFGFLVWSAVVFQRHAAELSKSELGSMVWLGLAMGLICWILGIDTNHRWIQAERRKKFNWQVPAFTLFLLATAGGLAIAAEILSWYDHPAMIPDPISLRYGFPAILGGTALSAILEWTRRYTPRPEEPEPALTARDMGSSMYRETSINWSLAICWPILAVVWLLWYQYDKSLETLVMGPVGLYALFTVSIRRLSVTSTHLTYWPGNLLPYRLAIADIVSCVPAHHEPGFSIRRRRPEGFLVTDGRCMEITLKDGRVCRFGALRPTHICRLINKPPADKPEAES